MSSRLPPAPGIRRGHSVTNTGSMVLNPTRNIWGEMTREDKRIVQ